MMTDVGWWWRAWVGFAELTSGVTLTVGVLCSPAPRPVTCAPPLPAVLRRASFRGVLSVALDVSLWPEASVVISLYGSFLVRPTRRVSAALSLALWRQEALPAFWSPSARTFARGTQDRCVYVLCRWKLFSLMEGFDRHIMCGWASQCGENEALSFQLSLALSVRACRATPNEYQHPPKAPAPVLRMMEVGGDRR